MTIGNSPTLAGTRTEMNVFLSRPWEGVNWWRKFLDCSKNTDYIRRMNTYGILQLESDIKMTNNGYLFAPSPFQVELARKHPDRFIVSSNPRNAVFPNMKYRIALK